MNQLEERKKTLADQMLNLEGKTSLMNQLCIELVEAMGICEVLDELLSGLLSYLEFTNTPEIAFETELIKVCKAICFLRGQTENIRAKLKDSEPKKLEIGLHFEWLRAVNKHLSAIKTRLENEIAIFRHQRIIL